MMKSFMLDLGDFDDMQDDMYDDMFFEQYEASNNLEKAEGGSNSNPKFENLEELA
jgi:hypothetical protein